MSFRRVHIFGASGSGTTTLGQQLAEKHGWRHFDIDDYFWEPTDPPFQTIRPVEERQRLLRNDLTSHDLWTLSGSLVTWGDPFMPMFDLAVFLYVPSEIRAKRILAREIERYGAVAIAPGGKMHQQFLEFKAWSEGYDTGGIDGRSLVRHENWMKKLSCPILRIDGDCTVKERLSRIDKLMKSE